MNPSKLNDTTKQKRLILLCCLVYSFAYAGRYSYNANIGSLISFYGITRADAGMVSTFFFFSYGAAQLLNAFLCKFYPKKYVVSGALIGSAAINLILFFLPSFGVIKYLWLLNGICQSVLWPSLLQTIGETIDQSMMKRAVFSMSLSVAIGTFLAYGGSSLFNFLGDFQFSFLFGTCLTTAIGLIWMLSYDVLAEKKFSKSVTESAQPTEERKNASGARALIGLLVICGIFAVVDNLVKDGLNTWSPVILKEQFHFDDSVSIILTLVLPLFGVFGSMIAMQTNRLIKDFRNLAGFFYVLLSACLLGLLFALQLDGVVATLILFGLISCITHAINSIVTSIMPLSLRDRINSGFLAGLMNATCYVGSTLSAYGLGKIADGASWTAVIRLLLIASLVAVLLAGGAMLANSIRKKKEI